MKRECRGLEVTSPRQATRTVALPDMRPLGARARSSSTGQGNVAFPWPGGWPLPAAGGRRHVIPRRPTMPCFLQSRQKAKRNELQIPRVPLRFDLGSKRPSRRDGLVALPTSANRRAPPDDLPPSSFSNATQRCDSSSGSRRELATRSNSRQTQQLFDFHLSAGLFQFFLSCLCVCLTDAFLHGLGCSVDQVFRFLEA